MKAALDMAISLISGSEGCSLRSYPDPASDLGKAMQKRRIFFAYMKGKAEIPSDLRHLDGAPWTIGYGETQGISEGMWWTQQQCDDRRDFRVAQFMGRVLKACPALYLEPNTRVAACTSLAYNIGIGAFTASSVRRLTMRREYRNAADAFRLWNKAKGRVEPGLTARREHERMLYLQE